MGDVIQVLVSAAVTGLIFCAGYALGKANGLKIGSRLVEATIAHYTRVIGNIQAAKPRNRRKKP